MVVKTILLVPIILSLTLGLGTQLADLANDASSKTVAFATSADEAVDCALRGVDISECSPELTSYDFEPEINRLNNLTQKYNLTLKEGQTFKAYYNEELITFTVQKVNNKSVLMVTDEEIAQSVDNMLTANVVAKGNNKTVNVKPYTEKFIDINKDGIYDIKMYGYEDDMTVELTSKPTVVYFLSSSLTVIGMILLAIYLVVVLNIQRPEYD